MEMMIDLRSDTVTKPTKAMLAAMMDAKVGDDVLEDDPTVKQLESKSAAVFGHEAALFCPSGTMTNQIAIKVHTNAPGEVICDELAHIYRYEGGGIGFNSGLSARLIKGDLGRFNIDQLKHETNDPTDIHLPPSQLISIENTCNKGGGSIWDLNEIKSISNYAKKQNLPLHLDGARIFNALVAKKTEPMEMGVPFDSISICLSKGLGCPVGSVLIGSNSFITQAKRIRKILGGGMRQAGFLAAAGIYALDHHVERLEEDHQKAKIIAKVLSETNYTDQVNQVESNIVLFSLKSGIDQNRFVDELKNNEILVSKMGEKQIRMVTHIDISDDMIDKLCSSLSMLQP